MAILLGLLSSVGPFSIDMYLPAMPAIREDLATQIGRVQMTITIYFASFGLAQMVYGPLADRYGRKRTLMAGLSLFVLGSILCAFATNIIMLNGARCIQGLGAAVAMVVPRAVVRDMYTGPDATRLMAMIMLVISVSPMLAPLAGSAVTALSSWRAIFIILTLVGIASIFATGLALPETLKQEDRRPFSPRAIASGTWQLLRDRHFMTLTFVAAFAFASFFVFLASASFVYMTRYSLSPTQFSLAFAVNAIGFFSMSQFAARFGAAFGMIPAVQYATAGFCLTALVLLALVAAGYDALWLVMALLFIANGFLGLVIPTTMVAALDPYGSMAGLASSLGGAMQMLTGGAFVALLAPFFDATPLPMVAAIAACGLCAAALSRAIPHAPAQSA